MIWSLVFVALLLAIRRQWAWIRGVVRNRRVMGLLLVSSTAIAINWGIYIWAVDQDRVVEASLGYFINPLVTVAMGVLLLKERLRRGQWVAVSIGAAAVVVLTVDYGRLPWIALTLAASFATYGLVKKTVGIGSLESLAVETALLFIPFLAYLLWLEAGGDAAYVLDGWTTVAAADDHRRGDRDPAADVRRLGPADPAVDDGAAAIHHAGDPVRPRRVRVRRGDAGVAVDRVRPGLAGAGRPHVRLDPGRPAPGRRPGADSTADPVAEPV